MPKGVLLGFLGAALAEPFGGTASITVARVIFHAGGDGFAVSFGFELEDEPLAFLHERQAESLGVLGDFQFHRLFARATGGSEGLGLHGHGFHILVQEGNVEFTILDGDFAAHGFVFAELEDATAVGTDFNAAMAKGDAGGECEEEGEEF